ncbi:MAG: potassium-transporting ATPase subunit KdpC [Armatimonadota bacterium]
MLTSLRIALLTMVLVGGIYPLIITGLGQLLFPGQAHGSLIREGTLLRGSTLIGQSFTEPGYFHPRPSAAGDGYDASASGGSNLGPTSKVLHKRVETAVGELRVENPGLKNVPVDMVTTSGSGLDPDITPANAYAQVSRVAAARGLPEPDVRQLVTRSITGRQLGVLGEPRVNVLQLNRALDMLPKANAR